MIGVLIVAHRQKLRKLVFINFAILIILATFNCADSVRYSADDIDKEVESSVNMKEPTSESKYSSSATINPGNEPHTIERQYYQQGEAVKIIKKIYPNKNDEYLLGDSNPIIIYVEIVPMVKEIKELWLHESIDNGLYVPYISDIYRADTVYEIKECNDNAINNISDINFSNNHKFEFGYGGNYSNLRTKGDIQLKKGQRLIYWYPIQTNESRIYNTRTSLRFYNDAFFPDIDYFLDIIIEDPKPVFDVGVTTLKKEVVIWSTYLSWLDVLNEPLDITYDITYLSGDGEDVNAKIFFDEMKYCKFINNINGNNSLIHTKILKKNETINISKTLMFNKTGIFSIPAPTICGKKWHFKDEEIVVITPLGKFREEIYVLIALIGLIFSDYISKSSSVYVIRLRKFLHKKMHRSEKTCQILEKIPQIGQKESCGDKVIFKTCMGDITFQLNQNMPNLTNQFKELINKGIYNGTKFNRIVKGSMIEGGDLTGIAKTRPSYAFIDSIIRKNNNDRGTFAISIDENSIWNGQFSINLADNNFLDKIRPVLGRVVDGMDVVDAIGELKTNNTEQPVKEAKIFYVRIMP